MHPFDKSTLVPCIVQSAANGQVLMLAYLNEEAYKNTLTTGVLTFYSRSREQLWIKGETSGNRLELIDLTLDCDADTFLATVIPSGPVCHTGDMTCFDRNPVFEKANPSEATGNPAILDELFQCIEDRKQQPEHFKTSYTSYLFTKGVDKILKKVGEEAAEVIIASKNPDKKEFLNECGDLIYHLWVLLSIQDLEPRSVYRILESRAKK